MLLETSRKLAEKKMYILIKVGFAPRLCKHIQIVIFLFFFLTKNYDPNEKGRVLEMYDSRRSPSSCWTLFVKPCLHFLENFRCVSYNQADSSYKLGMEKKKKLLKYSTLNISLVKESFFYTSYFQFVIWCPELKIIQLSNVENGHLTLIQYILWFFLFIY